MNDIFLAYVLAYLLLIFCFFFLWWRRWRLEEQSSKLMATAVAGAALEAAKTEAHKIKVSHSFLMLHSSFPANSARDVHRSLCILCSCYLPTYLPTYPPIRCWAHSFDSPFIIFLAFYWSLFLVVLSFSGHSICQHRMIYSLSHCHFTLVY